MNSFEKPYRTRFNFLHTYGPEEILMMQIDVYISLKGNRAVAGVEMQILSDA
jgi:hypothetical protein